MPNREGQQLGNYRLIRLLGRGGFAEVYLGEHLRLKSQAAIKVLHTSLEDNDIEDFLKEAQTLARLKHPHIVRVFDFDVDDHIPFLVMDYLPNGNVRRSYSKGISLPLMTIVSYVNQVASALQYAHDEHLIHRDIKPENMLLDQHSMVVLSDFGIALMMQSSRHQSTQEIVGTAAYMAPEQFQGKPRRASDQYALSIVVYEWLCGSLPFHGSFTEIASQHLFVPPPPLHEKIPMIPRDVEQVVLTALAKDPSRRFASVQAFARALEQACKTGQINEFAHPSKLTPLNQPSPPAMPVMSPTQLPAQTDIVTPPGQLSQPTVVATPTHTTAVSSSSTEGTMLSSVHQPPQRRVPRRIVVMGLVGLIAAGGGITWLELSQKPKITSSSFRPTDTAIPSPTPPPTQAPALGTTIYTYTGHNAGLRALAWSLDGKRVATASDDNSAQAWDATTGRNAVIYRGHSSYVEGVAWSPDNIHIVSGSADGTAQIWNGITGEHIYTYRGHIDTYSGSCCQTHPWVNRVGWSPDRKYIVSCDQASDPSRTVTVQIWDAASGKTLVTYRGHSNGIYAVAWSSLGDRIASAGYDGTLQIWDATTGNTIATYHGNAFLFGLSWSPDGKYVAVGSSNNSVLVVDATSGSSRN
ncbi:MAG TPA: protein kinase [Ktedonobacteraceae bacterium]|nr:protein kinase [Ktedonobacteraceae bacterium]